MKSPFVSEVEPNKVITTSFLVHSKEIRQKKSGEFYLSLLLGDRTGELDAKMWDNVAEVMDDFDRDDFVKVKGLIQVFHNRPQLTIHKMRRMDDSEIQFGDYFRSSKRDSEEMWQELRGVVAGIGNAYLKGLLEAMLDDPEIAVRYRRAPAAKSIHHAWLGGLIEHVLSLCTLARMAASHYTFVDYDLLIAGVVLHDIGKIYELNYERGFSYSDEGQLLGHIHIALRMVAEKMRGLPEFPPQLRTLVEHMILSHHGQLEFGSPKQPQFPEALLLHYLDDMDSKMECMRELIERDRQVEGCFTSFHNALGRVALKKGRYLNPPAEAARREPESKAELDEASKVVAPAAAAAHPLFAPVEAARPEPEAKTELDQAPQPVAAPEAAAHPLFAPAEAARPEPEARPELDQAPQPVAPPAAAAHPLFAPRPDPMPGEKVMAELEPAKQER